MKRVDYQIEKRECARWGYWDGPWSLREAVRVFDQSYRNPGGVRGQDFRIVKVTTTPVPFVRKKDGAR